MKLSIVPLALAVSLAACHPPAQDLTLAPDQLSEFVQIHGASGDQARACSDEAIEKQLSKTDELRCWARVADARDNALAKGTVSKVEYFRRLRAIEAGYQALNTPLPCNSPRREGPSGLVPSGTPKPPKPTIAVVKERVVELDNLFGRRCSYRK